MSYQVIARKWRPRSFNELVGQNHVSQTLLNALKSGRLPQALLFTGPRGTGKTSTARIFAKSLRCPDVRDQIPCHVCSECLDIASGRSFDVLEIDGASNNGVDAIRELRETVGHMPSSGKLKIYIIDEVHMLSTSAFNALLKTLEEPPPHVVFILATTEAQKIPNTILSRCQRFDFRTISTRLIADHLQKICSADGVEAEPEALWLLAQQAQGSMRDSQSLLDQVITYGNGRVVRTEVVEILGLTSHEVLAAALESLCTRDIVGALDVLRKVQDSGVEPKIFGQELLKELRNLLLVKLAPTPSSLELLDIPPADQSRLEALGKDLTPEDLHILFEMALKGSQDLQRTMSPQIVLEVLLLKMVEAPRVVDLERALLNQNHPLRNGVPTNTSSSKAPIPRQGPSTQPKSRPESPKTTDTATLATPPTEAPSVPKPSRDMEPSQTEPKNLSGVFKDPWFKFVSDVKASNGFLGALLENTVLKSRTPDSLTLEVPEKLEFLLHQLQEGQNRSRIESFIQTLWGESLTVSAQLQSTSGSSGSTLKQALQNQESVKKKSTERAVDQHPLVKDLKKKFNAHIVSIKEST